MVLKIIYIKFLLIIICSQLAWAHKVNIFAYIDKGTIKSESYYSKGKKVKNGIIKIIRAKDKKVLIKGKTDQNGEFSAKIPTDIENEDLIIILNASIGHRATWKISAQELTGQKITIKKKKEKSWTQKTGQVIIGLAFIWILFGIVYFIKRKIQKVQCACS